MEERQKRKLKGGAEKVRLKRKKNNEGGGGMEMLQNYRHVPGNNEQIHYR